MDPDLVRQQEEEAQSYRRAHNGATRIVTNGGTRLHHDAPDTSAAAPPLTARAEEPGGTAAPGAAIAAARPAVSIWQASLFTVIDSATGALAGVAGAVALIVNYPWLASAALLLTALLAWTGGLLFAAVLLKRRCGLSLGTAISTSWLVVPVQGAGLGAAALAAAHGEQAVAGAAWLLPALAALSGVVAAWLIHSAVLSRALRRIANAA